MGIGLVPFVGTRVGEPRPIEEAMIVRLNAEAILGLRAAQAMFYRSRMTCRQCGLQGVRCSPCQVCLEEERLGLV